MIKRTVIWFYSVATYLLWLGIILFAIVVLGMRYFVLPEVHGKKDFIAEEASKAAGLRVTIGNIEASWEGLRPHIDLFNVTLYDEQNRPALTLEHVEAEPSWLSLAVGEVRLASLVVHKPSLVMRRQQDGAIYVAGISLRGPSRPQFPNWLLRQSQVDVVGATVLWLDEQRGAPPLALEKLSLRLTSSVLDSMLNRHHFGLQATPSVAPSKPIDIRGEVSGEDVSQTEQWSGTLYARLDGIDMAVWNSWLSYPFEIRQGNGAMQFWLDFSHDKADAVTADVALSDVVSQLGPNTPLTPLRQIAGRLAWDRLADGEEMRLSRLSLLTSAGLDIHNGALRLSRRQVNGNAVQAGDIGLEAADLERVSAFAAALPLDQPVLEQLRAVSPKGPVGQMQLSWSATADKLTRYAISGKFSGLSIQPNESLPGFAGLSGTVDANQDGGTLSLDSANARLDFSNRLNRTIPVDRLSASANWKRNDNKLELTINNLDISGSTLVAGIKGSYRQTQEGEHSINLGGKLKLLGAEGFDIRDGAVRVNMRPSGGKTASDGEIRLDDVVIEQVAAFASSLPLDPAWLEKSREIAPRGRVQNLRLTWVADAAGIKRYGLSGRFTELGMRPYQSIPGFYGLAGTLDADQDGGSLRLDSNRALLDLKDVLRWPIAENKLAGDIKWSRVKDKLSVNFNGLSIANPHLAGTFSASYQYSGKGSGNLDLSGKISRADAKYALYYYPRTLSADTLHWLDTSVLAGRTEDASVIVKGDLDEFPWPDSKRGLFQIKGLVTQGVVDYADHWPKVEGLRGNLLFQGNRMELNANQGHLLGNNILQAKAVIADLNAAHPWLKITGDLQGPVEEAFKYINNSPLLEATGRFTEHLQAGGNGRLALDLGIPLDTEGVGSKVKGAYQVSEGRLAGNDDMPTIEHINGRFDFTEASLQAQNVNAQVFGGAARFGLQTGQDGQLQVNARVRLSDSNLRQIGAIPMLDHLHGAADWEADITLREGLADIRLNSSLAGLASSLPEPFNKAADTTLPLVIEKKAQSQQQETLSVTLGSILSAKLLRRAQGKDMVIERGEIALGGGTVELPAKPGVAVKGTLAYVDLDRWLDVSGPAQKGNSAPVISSINVSLGMLDVFKRRFNALKLNARNTSDGWQASLQGKEINGDVQFQNKGRQKVVARLKSLVVPSAPPAELSAPRPQSKNESEYPALDIVAEEFDLPPRKLGKLELVANPRGNDWDIEKLVLSNPDSILTMNGKLQNWEHNPSTGFNLNWKISNIGKTMDRYGKPGTIKDGKATISGRLDWIGSFGDYDPEILQGNLVLSAENGQILKIQPGVGRLFSILSLQNLPRRLTFDFRDVFSDGFSFDKIDSTLTASKGIVQIEKFHMEGPAAKVDISGETNLVKETQNLLVKVTPAISDSLSLAAFAGGPAVGAGVWIAQKLLRGPADKLAAFQFEITGTWANPQEVSAQKVPRQPVASPSPMGLQ